jgi:hypothetical protein
MPMKQRFMSYSARLVFLSLLCVAASFSAFSAVFEGLYDAKVLVENQSSSQQDSALKQGLSQVLLKVRGQKDLLRSAEIRRALSRATRYVKAYRYEQDNMDLYLVVNFDQEKIDTLVRSAGFPVWGQRRPDTIVWLAMQAHQDAQRAILKPDSAPDFYQRMSEQAQRRGIKLVFPLWDLDDLQNVSVYDIWGEFGQRMANASQRYGVSSVLSARIYQFDQNSSDNNQLDSSLSEFFSDEELAPIKQFKQGQWIADWTSVEDGKFVSGQLAVTDYAKISTRLVDAVADILAERYAIDIESNRVDAQMIEITINNVSSIEVYVEALTFLQSLSVVNTATLVQQQGSRGTFALSLFGDLEDLNNALSLDRNIQPVLDDFGQPLEGMEFIWSK